MSPLPPQPLSPLDGRYRTAVGGLGEHLSEAGLNRARVRVEVEWLIALTARGMFGAQPLDPDAVRRLRSFAEDFGAAEISELAELEATTRHDVKAVEYLVRSRLDALGLSAVAELTHFACTSEDINNLAYGITVRAAVHEVWLPRLREVIAALRARALAERATPMLARTHGQPATPTTFGKELAVFVARLERVAGQIAAVPYLGKFSGATGTFSAHVAADAQADWPAISREFVESLGLTWNPLTTQIESHDAQAELFAALAHAGRILHNLCTDVWTYISLGYLTQIPQEGATGSSTMPHKVNPIRFENAEANLEISGALFDALGATLVTSRLQRDLTDSTTQRNIGVALGHSLLALDNIARGLGEVAVNRDLLAADLDANWEVLGEAVQTVIRAEVAAGRSSIADPYALLKELTRGRRLGSAELAAFIDGLDIGDDAKARLRSLTPATYTGLADRLVDFLPAAGDTDPGHVRISVGGAQIVALRDGEVAYPVSTIVGATDEQIAAGLAAVGAGAAEPVPMSYNAFLLLVGGRRVLVDTGTGGKRADHPGFRGTGEVGRNLRAAGERSEEIDDVLISHIGLDHVGGLTDDAGRMAYPNATVHIARAELDFLNEMAAEDASGWFAPIVAQFELYERAGRLHAFDADGPVVPGVRALLTPGHTPGHASFLLDDDGARVIVLGDLVHWGAVQFAVPAAATTFDADQAGSVTQRRRILEMAADEGILVAGAHLRFPGIGTVSRADDGFAFAALGADDAR